MRKKIISLAVFCLISLGNNANAQTTTNTAPTVPTEVGTTTMPPGNYLVIDQSTGNKYSLMVTSKGTMVFGPAAAASTTTTTTTTATTPPAAPSASSKAAAGVKGLAETQVEKYIQNKGMSEIQNFIK